MPWRTVAALALGLVGLTGCPEDFGKDGTNDRAVRKDMQELLLKHDCSEKEFRMFCSEGREQTEECRRQCS